MRFLQTSPTFLFLTSLLLTLACSSPKNSAPPPSRPPLSKYDPQVEALLQKMTLDEKIGQLTLFTTDWESTGPTIREGYKDDIRQGRCGALFNAHTVKFTRELQRIAVEETRLKIPLIFGYDVIHGYKTIFPIPLGEAASFDLKAIENAARVAAAEASAAGLHWTFAPMVDVARDPRWGRVMEGAGEDTEYGSQVAAARVRGFQGKGLGQTDAVMACAKHYAGYGAALAGRDYNTTDISERALWETYLPPFKACADAGVATFMTGFNDLDGIPATANRMLLTDILRGQWNFQGFVVTDYTSINELVNHGIAADDKHAGELALNAGADMDMQGAVYQRFLKKSLAEKQVSEKTIDEAVRRILRKKFELGLFENPYKYCDEERERRTVFSKENQEAARDAARKSIVLLKNDRVLPLSKNVKTLAVIGPLADNQADLLGAWSGSGEAKDCVSLLRGIGSKLTRQTVILTAKGCEIEGEDRSGFAEAIEKARQADAVVVAVGERAQMSGEAACRADISLPGVQEELVRQLVATGKPVVVVLMNGRPLTFPDLAEKAPAILETWFLGSQAGNAIADVLFGDYNPSGKLPMTFPRSVGQVPLFYNQKNTGRPYDPNSKWNSRYTDIVNTPQYPFGWGLSYTTFEYSGFRVAPATDFSAETGLTVFVTVANTGSREGEEVVQLYIRDLVGSVTRPVKELRAFEKINLKPGERREVKFHLPGDDFAFLDAGMKWRTEAGEFDIMVGGNSVELMSLRVRMVK